MCICSWLPERREWMSMNPKHGQTVSFVVVPYSNYTVVASLCWGQQCCVAIKSQSRHLQRKHMGGCSKNYISVKNTLQYSLLNTTALEVQDLGESPYLGCCQDPLCHPTHWKRFRSRGSTTHHSSFTLSVWPMKNLCWLEDIFIETIIAWHGYTTASPDLVHRACSVIKYSC